MSIKEKIKYMCFGLLFGLILFLITSAVLTLIMDTYNYHYHPKDLYEILENKTLDKSLDKNKYKRMNIRMDGHKIVPTICVV